MLLADSILLRSNASDIDGVFKAGGIAGLGTNPLIHRRHEIDGIMSAIDFSMDIVREPDPKGDRANVVLSGKFLPYKQY